MSIIKKVIITIIILGVVVIRLFNFVPFRSEPPTPTITAGNTIIPTTQGSYCWDGIFSAQCVDLAYTSPLDMAKEHQPTVVSPNAEIKIDFPKEPTADTWSVEQWIDKDKIEDVELEMKNNQTIFAPKEKGIYVYHVLANWKQGDGNSHFPLK